MCSEQSRHGANLDGSIGDPTLRLKSLKPWSIATSRQLPPLIIVVVGHHPTHGSRVEPDNTCRVFGLTVGAAESLSRSPVRERSRLTENLL